MVSANGVENKLWFQVKWWHLRVSEKYNEMRFGIESDGLLSPTQVGISDPDSMEYAPVPYRVLNNIFKALRVSDKDVFVDVGCGMGRPLVVAARYPFKRIIGIEISPELAAKAETNIAKLDASARSRMQVVTINALDWVIPDDVTIMFFANPFRGETLRCVIENIRRSLIRAPREIKIVYYNRLFFEEQTAGRGWLTKTLHLPCFPHASWAMYVADGRHKSIYEN